MNGFKLLAIRTGSRINSEKNTTETDYLKILEENTFYTFYNEYSFSEDDRNINIDYNHKTPQDLYNIKTPNGKEIEVNISAIVGKNGSGKSTLLELLYLAIYNLGSKYKLLKKTVKREGYEGPKCDKNCNNLIPYDYEDCKLKNLDLKLYYTEGSKIVQLYFYGVKIFLLSKEISNQVTFNVEDIGNEVIGKDNNDLYGFFYSIAVNYSIYGLNSNIIGDWIIPLFHKNDAYKTPIVINPMRTEGNFDINDEIEFAKYRLLNNLLIEKYLNKKYDKANEVFVTERQYIRKIRFKYTGKEKLSDKINHANGGIKGEKNTVSLILNLQTVFFNDSYLDEVSLNKSEIPFKVEIFNYIVHKIDKIKRTYKEYENIEENLVETLKNDGSHITFKLKQAINYLRKNLEASNQKKWKSLLSKLETDNYIDFTLDELLKWVNTTNISDFINHLPPSIFSIDVLLSSTNDTSKESLSSFEELSSGEQQLIHSIQSVLYHINNIQSVHNSNDNGRVKYNYINIIFDEIELYFHPEYQRKFINELLNSFERLDLGKKGEGIQGINIIFSTHSPFILSDVASSNILMLNKKGNKEKNSPKIKTYGANIHELLGDSFFLENGYVGEFAKRKIEELIEFYNNPKLSTHTKESSISLIKLIDDKLISDRLIEMHNECFNINEDIPEILDEDYEKWLNDELSRIKKG